MKYTLLGACFFCGANIVAQNNDKRGVEFGLELTTELQATDKGDYNNANLLRLDVSLPVSSSVSFDAASISTCMTASESIGGDLQIFSNLDAGNIPFALSVLGVNWHINDRHSLFMGIRNVSEDYFASPVTSFFVNSSCGIYPTISANYPIANYPVASVGMHYCYEGDPVKVKASLYNGTGYYRFTGRDNVFRVCPKNDGVFGIAEAEYMHKGSSFFLGACAHYNKVGSEDVHRQVYSTLWSYAEQNLTNRVSLIAAYSHAFSWTECSDFIGIGGKYAMPKCELGIFSDMAHFEEATEFATEISGKYNFSSHFYVQPSVHAIFTGRAFHAAAVLRLGMAL